MFGFFIYIDNNSYFDVIYLFKIYLKDTIQMIIYADFWGIF